MRRVIWQYWETRGTKPAFIDGLHLLAKRNSGCDVVLVTPKNLPDYLPDLPSSVQNIRELAHKADMIRTMLVARYGGMWLDSDAIVLDNLCWIFDEAEDVDFLGFNDGGRLGVERPWVRVNCFVSQPSGFVVSEWQRLQHAKTPRTVFGWEEIGTELLHSICLKHQQRVKILPFELISPIAWDHVAQFGQEGLDAEPIVSQCSVVMLSNSSLKLRAPHLQRQSCADLAAGRHLLAAIVRHALRDQPVDYPTLESSICGKAARKLRQHASLYKAWRPRRL